MPVPKKWIPILSLLTVAVITWLLKPVISRDRWRSLPPDEGDTAIPQDGNRNHGGGRKGIMTKHTTTQKLAALAPFQPGIVRPVGEPYTKILVVPRTKEEDVDWIQENFGGDEHIIFSIYTVDDVEAELHPPKNKGHEVIVYLSYIIDHYNNLSDVNIFIHSHRFAWHNNDLLDNDVVQIISRLSAERVQREGYMNLRCHWDPGCPSWMHPGTLEEDINKQEETMVAKSWSEIFPLDPMPNVLAQPCCAQFAISKDRIRSIPLARFVFYRDWLLRTNLSDYISGRVWEYVWQFVFTGKNVVCPKENVCYCDGFGVCLGGEDEYNAYYTGCSEIRSLEEELEDWRRRDMEIKLLTEGDMSEERNGLGVEIQKPEVGKDLELEGRINGLKAWCAQKRQKAKEYGDVAANRAKEAGREWKDGDGF
jgi:hypothetical protein